jgi:hypothetical protein
MFALERIDTAHGNDTSGRVTEMEESLERWFTFIVADKLKGLLGKRCERLTLDPLVLLVEF